MKNDRLEEIRESINSFCKDRDWAQFHDPKNMAIALNLEASEVLELFQWSQDNQLNENRKDKIADELSDVMYWLVKLYDHYDIDILKSFNEKMKKNISKYPIEKSKGVSKKYNELD